MMEEKKCCECGHDHNHEHAHHETETVHRHTALKSKYEQALEKYNLNVSDEEVAQAVRKIVEEKVPRECAGLYRESEPV